MWLQGSLEKEVSDGSDLQRSEQAVGHTSSLLMKHEVGTTGGTWVWGLTFFTISAVMAMKQQSYGKTRPFV